MRKLISYLLIFCLCCCVGCGPIDKVVIALDSIAIAAATAPAIAVALLAAGKIEAKTANTIFLYSQNVSRAVIQANSEWASPDPMQIKITKISEYFSVAIVPSALGMPPELVSAIEAIGQSIQAFLLLLQNSNTGPVAMRSLNNSAPSLSKNDLKALNKTIKKAEETIRYCDKHRK